MNDKHHIIWCYFGDNIVATHFWDMSIRSKAEPIGMGCGYLALGHVSISCYSKEIFNQLEICYLQTLLYFSNFVLNL